MADLFPEMKRREYYLRTRDAHRTRAAKREAEKAEACAAYKRAYYQQVTKKKNHGLPATTPVRGADSKRNHSKCNSAERERVHESCRAIPAPPSTQGMQRLEGCTIFWD